MFRRKEDSLFDTATDPNQPQAEGEAVTVLPTQASPAASASASSSSPYAQNPSASQQPGQPSSPTSSYGSASAAASPLQPTNRPLPEARPAAPTANAFRPAGSAPSARMPEPNKAAQGISSPQGGNAERPSKSGRRVLTVGSDILLKGEIATCDRLVIEGKVDATLNEVHTVEIAETGSFKGSAHIEDAEISGLFEGDLIVRNRLVIYATGKVRGKISYGEIEIERGGELTGEIKATNAQNTSNRPSARKLPEKDKEAA